MSNEIVIYGAFGLLFVVLIVILWLKDKQISSKFAKFEVAIEGLIKENYQLKKQFIEQSRPPQVIQNNIDLDELDEHIWSLASEILSSKMTSVVENIKIIEQMVTELKDEQQERIYSLEERTKSIGKITPPSLEESNENRIVEMYRAGKSPESIARDLQLGVGQVTMILKFRKEM